MAWRRRAERVLALHSLRSIAVVLGPFPFPGGDRTDERKTGRAKEHAWGKQKIGVPSFVPFA